MNRIGVFAGSFDPIHDGHIEVAKSALDYLELDKMLFMVEEKPWTDKKPISIVHRKAMVALAIEDNTNIEQLALSDARFDIQKTLPKIEALYPEDELFFVCGADVFLRMNPEQWPGLGALLAHYIVVFERNNIIEETITTHAKELGIVVAILPSMHPHHSSTDVRRDARNKQVWVPRKVADYIDKHKLYEPLKHKNY